MTAIPDEFASAQATLDALYDQYACANGADKLRLQQAASAVASQLSATREALFMRGVKVTAADQAQLKRVQEEMDKAATVQAAISSLGNLLSTLKRMA
ncbi:hypothetical protein JCM19000A_21980 [Silvimonas sp. JCM 19000]